MNSQQSELSLEVLHNKHDFVNISTAFTTSDTAWWRGYYPNSFFSLDVGRYMCFSGEETAKNFKDLYSMCSPGRT